MHADPERVTVTEHHEDVEAWTYGPVIRPLYHRMKTFGAGPVTDRVATVFGDPESIEPDQDSIIGQVFDLYGSLSGPQLSQMTHQSGTPWTDTRKRFGPGAVIPQEAIQCHFEDLAREHA